MGYVQTGNVYQHSVKERKDQSWRVELPVGRIENVLNSHKCLVIQQVDVHNDGDARWSATTKYLQRIGQMLKDQLSSMKNQVPKSR